MGVHPVHELFCVSFLSLSMEILSISFAYRKWMLLNVNIKQYWMFFSSKHWLHLPLSLEGFYVQTSLFQRFLASSPRWHRTYLYPGCLPFKSKFQLCSRSSLVKVLNVGVTVGISMCINKWKCSPKAIYIRYTSHIQCNSKLTHAGSQDEGQDQE